MQKKIGPFIIEKYDFYGSFWSSKSPMEDARKDSEPYLSLEKDSRGTWELSVMGGEWCETHEYHTMGTFNDCVKSARGFYKGK
jgi:hypothetical protein